MWRKEEFNVWKRLGVKYTQLCRLPRAINIIRYADGTTSKVLIK